ncbi:Dps family protein [Rhodovibrio salinarum]|uniref:DNA starvation/stationary phase protection protein n=1 Tax=Rhodovibrio salinarum TaxID=1087 RepID=A0A934QLR5_9PROT|nr:Dps family protein [Rhodovibrio salinarum]MBK1699004.1 DNA starvation/stationary phase protection protein [Rhodovibrio salinarum]
MTPPNSAFSAEDRKKLADGLARVLAGSYTLYLKTHNYHWNVEGPNFKGLHDLFEEQYTDLAEAVDEVAERIRALGHYAPGSFAEFAQLSVISEETGQPDAMTMVRQLADDQDSIANTCRQVLQTAEDAGDAATDDLLATRVQTHEKNAWMLRAYLA